MQKRNTTKSRTIETYADAGASLVEKEVLLHQEPACR